MGYFGTLLGQIALGSPLRPRVEPRLGVVGEIVQRVTEPLECLPLRGQTTFGRQPRQLDQDSLDSALLSRHVFEALTYLCICGCEVGLGSDQKPLCRSQFLTTWSAVELALHGAPAGLEQRQAIRQGGEG